MTDEQLTSQLTAILPELKFEKNDQFLTIIIAKDKLHSFCKTIKDKEELNFDYLFCLTGIDWKTHLGVIYHLNSSIHKHSIVIKVKEEDRKNPTIDTVSDLWKTAEFHEREVFDLFGIKFNHHPDLRRIFLDDDWQGYPLRKDYEDDVNMVTF